MGGLELRQLSYGQVTVREPFLMKSMKLEKEYLLSLDADRLLAGFRETAGRKAAAMRYPGWESTEIQGHTMGHYLTALSQLWAYGRDPEVLSRVKKIVNELALCQREDGYLCAFPESLFDRVERKEPAWVPWYTMHKIISGVTAAYCLCGIQKAYDVMRPLADWVAGRALSWSAEVRDTVLAVEYGGMNDCMYEVYRLTGDPRHAQAAHQFDEMPLFEAMEEGRDILDGLHANTTIPKILGGLKRYEVTGGKEPFYLKMAQRFWDMVTEHHTYITGGNSEWEHFGKPDILDGERTACNCETCNTYNMLKLTSLLFRLTGEKKYADYDERAYLNAILSSQNHETGMTTYFQPMAAGYFKVYSRPYDNFWCCTGTGMENFTKQCEGICYAGEDTLYINRFLSADIEWKEKGVRLEMRSDLLSEQSVSIRVTERNGSLEAEKTESGKAESGKQEESNAEAGGPGIAAADSRKPWKLAVRVPAWTAGEPEVKISGNTSAMATVREQGGYLLIEGLESAEDEVELSFPMRVSAHTLPDNPHAAAFTYGPYVLSADLGTEDMEETTTGVDVTVPAGKTGIKDCLLYDCTDFCGIGKIKDAAEEDLAAAASCMAEKMKRRPKAKRAEKEDSQPAEQGLHEMEFTLTDASGEELVFAPHFLKNRVRYGIYFYLFEKGSRAYGEYRTEKVRKEYIMSHRAEVIPLGNDQYELAHGIRGNATEAVNESGKRGRSAKPGGWFSYEMQIPEKACVLHMTPGEGASFEVTADGELLSLIRLGEMQKSGDPEGAESMESTGDPESAESMKSKGDPEGAESVQSPEMEIAVPVKYAGQRVRIEFRNTDPEKDMQLFNELSLSVKE